MPDTKNTFNSIAKVYDRINNIISLGKHKKWKKDFVTKSNMNGKILDIATGTGDIIRLIKEKYPVSECYGLDPSQNMLKIAKEKSQNINFLKGYAENIPFENKMFDYVTISFGIRNTKSIEKSLEEIHRVLKDNKYLYIMEFSRNENPIMKLITNIYLFLFIPLVGLLFGKFKEYFYLSSSINKFYTPKEFNELLSKNNFKVLEIKSFNLGIVTIYTAAKI